MKKYNLSLCITISLIMNGYSQFREINPYPVHNVGNLTDVFFITPEEIVIRVMGDYDGKIKTTILKTQDSGYSWKFVNINVNDGQGGRIYSINRDSFIILSDAFYLTPDQFKSFSKISDYYKDAYDNILSPDHFFVLQNRCYATFEKKFTNPDIVGTYISIDHGKTLSKVCNTTIKEINFMDKNIGYGIGYGETVEFNRIFKTTDGGNSWFDLHGINDTGLNYNFKFKEHFYSYDWKFNLRRSDDEGKTWKNIQSRLPSGSNSGSSVFISADVGLSYHNSKGLYRTTYAGENWTQISDFSYPQVFNINTLQKSDKVYITVSEYNSAKTGIIYGVFDSTTIFTNSIIEPIKQTQYKIYPNPTKNHVTISYTGFISSATKVRLYDMQGKLLKEQSFGLGETVINLENFSNGVYILKIFEENGVFVNKIVKE